MHVLEGICVNCRLSRLVQVGDEFKKFFHQGEQDPGHEREMVIPCIEKVYLFPNVTTDHLSLSMTLREFSYNTECK